MRNRGGLRPEKKDKKPESRGGKERRWKKETTKAKKGSYGRTRGDGGQGKGRRLHPRTKRKRTRKQRKLREDSRLRNRTKQRNRDGGRRGLG